MLLGYVWLQVDVELERVSKLWTNIEVIFDLMLLKGDHVEKFIDYAKNPRVVERFRV